MTPDALANLHGQALPPAPGWWPPAPGWWLVLLCGLLLIAGLLWWWRRHQARAVLRERTRAVVEGIHRLQSLADAGAQRQYATQADHLIRQVARTRHGLDGVGLSGAAWQQWLAAKAPEDCEGADWRLLAEFRYRKQAPAVDLQVLHRHCRRWLEHNTPC